MEHAHDLIYVHSVRTHVCMKMCRQHAYMCTYMYEHFMHMHGKIHYTREEKFIIHVNKSYIQTYIYMHNITYSRI
jgi:hypothetical protein